MSAGWIKVYPPGAFRGRDGWHVRGRDSWDRPIEGRLPAKVTTAGVAERVGRQLLRQSNSRPPAIAPASDAVETAKGPDHSFEAAARAYRRSRRPSAAEWDRIEKLIACPEIGPVDVASLGTDQVATFATESRPHVLPDTLNREVVTPYSSVIHFACDEGWREYIRIRRFPEEEDENKAITPAEVDRLVAHADRTGSYKVASHARIDTQVPYKLALLEYLRLPGTRVTDALKMRPEDLDKGSGHASTWAGERLDRRERRAVPAKVMALLTALPPCRDGWLFPWRAKSSIHEWISRLSAALKFGTGPRLFHQASRDPSIDAGIALMISHVDRTGSYLAVSPVQRDRNAAYKVALLEYLRLRGTRITDVLQLQRARDLDLQGGRVRLTIGKRRDKVQWLPLSPKVVALLANLKPCDGVWVFPWRTRSGVYKWYNPLRRGLGIEATPHQFRHALGEEAIDAEIDLLTLRTMMGAASLNSVKRYARSSRKRLEQADRLRAELAAGGKKPEPVEADKVGTLVGKIVSR